MLFKLHISLCRTISALFLIIQKSICFVLLQYTSVVKNQVKKNSGLLSSHITSSHVHSLCTRYTIQYFYEGSRHFHWFCLGSVLRCLKVRSGIDTIVEIEEWPLAADVLKLNLVITLSRAALFHAVCAKN